MASSCAVSFSRAHPGEVGSWRPSAPITSRAVSAVDPRKARRRVVLMLVSPGIVQTAATTAVIEHDGPIVAMPPWSGDIPNLRGVAPDPGWRSRMWSWTAFSESFAYVQPAPFTSTAVQ
nr:unnamed protein product [Leishmania braziliensis]